MSRLAPVPQGRPPHLEAYRRHTCALLRRYFRLSLSIGRLPSVLGTAVFRTRVTCYRLQNFEDVVIFVHDVEQCLQRLDRPGLEILAAIVLQEYTREEAAACCGISLAQAQRRYTAALDALSQVLLERELLPAVWKDAGTDRGDGAGATVEAEQWPPRKPPQSARPADMRAPQRRAPRASAMMQPGAGAKDSPLEDAG